MNELFTQLDSQRDGENLIPSGISQPAKYRVAILPIEEVTPLLVDLEQRNNINVPSVATVGGYVVRVKSIALGMYKKSTLCLGCNRKAAFFAVERNAYEPFTRYQLSLYGYDKYGQEVLYTKDHIIPKAIGGSDSVDNLQIFCALCNMRKGAGKPLSLDEALKLDLESAPETHLAFMEKIKANRYQNRRTLFRVHMASLLGVQGELAQRIIDLSEKVAAVNSKVESPSYYFAVYKTARQLQDIITLAKNTQHHERELLAEM